MNTITVKDDTIHSNFPIDIKDNKIFLKDIDLKIIYESSSINFSFFISNNVKLFEYYNLSNIYNKYYINKDSNFNLYRFNLNCSIKTDINLDNASSSLLYKYSCLNFSDNDYLININHNAKNTKSVVINNGLNMTNSKLNFIINSNISKNSNNTFCNQDSKIILIGDNNSSIKPNMIVDIDDVIANHSAYLGHFKEEWLFYLESRGIDKKDCIKLLTKAFLVGIMDIDFSCKEMILNDLSSNWR